jgi:histidyl-tRNA synthetase
VKVLGGRETPTCGFAFGFDRLILALEKDNYLFDEVNKAKYLVVPATKGLLNEAIKIARKLRERRNIPVEVEIMRRRIGKALSYANAEGISHVIILGEEEYKMGQVTVKELKTGNQNRIDLEEVVGIES